MELPKWNPRVLDTLESRQPKSLIEVAEAYGSLFAEVHQHWLRALLETSEASTEGSTILTDEDPRHAEINSAINRALAASSLCPQYTHSDARRDRSKTIESNCFGRAER